MGGGEADGLHELDASLEEAERHAEELVKAGLLPAYGLERSVGLGTLERVGPERGRNRPVAAQRGGIDVPSGVNLSGKDDFGMCRTVGFQTCGELHWIGHLGLHTEARYERKQDERGLVPCRRTLQKGAREAAGGGGGHGSVGHHVLLLVVFLLMIHFGRDSSRAAPP